MTMNNESGLSAAYPRLVSGYGVHTKSFDTITIPDLAGMVINPQNVDKSHAKWFIPSVLKSRQRQEQLARGQYYALLLDIDDMQGMTFKGLCDIANSLSCYYLAFTTKSATEDNQKSRLIIPLGKPISGKDFERYQMLISEYLDINADEAVFRANQLSYLPNKGKYYRGHVSQCLDYIDLSFLEADYAELIEYEQQQPTRNTSIPAPETNGTERDLNRIGAILNYCDPNSEYEEWRNIIFSVTSYLGINGRTIKLLDEWSSKAVEPDKYLGINDVEQQVNKYKPHYGITIKTLYQYANQAGADISAIENEFKPLASEVGFTTIPPAIAPNLRQVDTATTINSGGLHQFSLNGLSSDMKKKMLDEKYIVKDLAILGQLTVFYAAPNTGKTLVTLSEISKAITIDNLDGNKLFYINADDGYNAAVFKLQYAEKAGFNMIIPDIGKSDIIESNEDSRFRCDDIVTHLNHMIVNNEAHGCIVIFDTLKKFTDVMNKTVQSEFNKVLRSFSAKGGSVIALAHTNKREDANGRKIHAGTSDIKDDFDCAYIVDTFDESSDIKTVCFTNDKARGDVTKEVYFQYSTEEGINYFDLLESVKRVDKPSASSALNNEIITVIHSHIRNGVQKKTELVTAAHNDLKDSYSKADIKKVLIAKEGIEWSCDVGERNVHFYTSKRPQAPSLPEKLKN